MDWRIMLAISALSGLAGGALILYVVVQSVRGADSPKGAARIGIVVGAFALLGVSGLSGLFMSNFQPVDEEVLDIEPDEDDPFGGDGFDDFDDLEPPDE